MTYNSLVLADNPIRYWKLDDSTGVDSMGGGNLTKLGGANTPTTGVAGKYGTAWSFDGADGMQCPNLSTTYTAFSFECWFNGGPKSDPSTFWRTGQSGGDVGLVRLQGSSSGALNGQVGFWIGPINIFTGTRYDDNVWHHVVGTVNGINAVLYVDGVQKATSAAGASSYNYTISTHSFGYDGWNPGTESLLGSLDEMAMYNYALTSTQVAAHYAGPVTLFKGWGIAP